MATTVASAPSTDSAADVASTPQLNRRVIGLLSLAHGSVDLNPSALAALLPFFYQTLHLTYAATAMLTATSQISSSVCQLGFGYLSDRTSVRWLIPFGCLVAGVGLALTALAPSYPALMVTIAASGLGVAAFHPEAARNANRFSGRERATGMSIFSVGGNVGFAGGPVVVAALGAILSRHGALVFAIPAAVVDGIVWLQLQVLPTGRTVVVPSGQGKASGVEPPQRAIILLTLVTILRSITQVGLLTFVPLYEVTALHRSQGVASSLLTVFLAAGAAGTLASGAAADRWGRKRVVIVSFIAGAPLLALFSVSDGALAYVALAGVGLALLSTFAVTIVMGQELLPNRAGLAAALVIGFASGVGGAAVSLLGHAADRFGPGPILHVMFVFPLLAALLSMGLVESRR